MPDNEDTSLQAKLVEYQRACKEEFEIPVDQLTQEDIRLRTKSLMVSGIPKAAATLLDLAEFAESESVRISAAKFIIDNGLGTRGGNAGERDTMAELIDQLTKSEPDTDANSNT